MSNIIDKIRISGTTYDLPVGISSGEVETMISAATSGYTARFAEDEEVTAAALNDLNENKQDKLSAGTGISISGNVISATGGSGGNPTVELTQAEYDALVSGGTVSADTYYIITDATPIDMSNYVETSAITSSVTSASTDNEIPTAKAVWEAASGGGGTYTAGRGIDITNDTISVSLPISAGTGTNSTMENAAFQSAGYASHAEGNYTNAFGNNSHAEGRQTQALGSYSHTEGGFTIANNSSEHASGQFNISSSASTTFGDSGNTLFSVGNGTADNARHNAFEIRQNGDIYLTLDGQDVKLQDHLGGGEVSSAITSGDTNAVAGGAVYDKFDEVEQVTAAGLNALNDKFGGLKLVKITQTDYNNLQVKDANTLYIIVN